MYALLLPAATDTARFLFAAIAAFNMSENSGLIPQVRHGGRGNASVAIVGSKFEGTGLEKEQIGQIQVPRSSWGDATRTGGLGALDTGVEAEDSFWINGDGLVT